MRLNVIEPPFGSANQSPLDDLETYADFTTLKGFNLDKLRLVKQSSNPYTDKRFNETIWNGGDGAISQWSQYFFHLGDSRSLLLAPTIPLRPFR